MNPIQKLIGEAEEDFSEYEELLALDAEQEKTLFSRPAPMLPEDALIAAYKYGRKGAPIEIEKSLATSALHSYVYAKDVLDFKRFPLGERAISKSPGDAYYYAKDILRGRWTDCVEDKETAEAAEASILGSYAYADDYMKFIMSL